MVNNSTNTKWTTTSDLKQLNTKKTTTYDVGNPSPDLGQAQKCGRVNPVKEIIDNLKYWSVFLTFHFEYYSQYFMIFKQFCFV